MKVQDNEELKEQIHKLENTLLDTAHKLHELRNLVDSGSGDIDAIEATAEFDKLIFDFRKIMFDGKIELEKIQKGVHKHVSHCLNPIPKTAPKKAKASARKKKDADLPVKQDVDYMIDFIEKTNPLSNKNRDKEVMKDVIETATKGKTMVIKRGNAPKDNPAHLNDKPFE